MIVASSVSLSRFTARRASQVMVAPLTRGAPKVGALGDESVGLDKLTQRDAEPVTIMSKEHKGDQ